MSTTKPAPRFVVLTASAHMPNKVKHPYRRVAVVELAEPGVLPKMISRRARGVARIVQTWERCHVGSGSPRTAYGRALAEAHALAERLNEDDCWARKDASAPSGYSAMLREVYGVAE